MAKIVYNACYGGFSLSNEGIMRYAEIKGIKLYPDNSEKWAGTTFWTVPKDQQLSDDDWGTLTLEQRVARNTAHRNNTIGSRDFDREDPVLVQVVEEMGQAAEGICASLRIKELPDGTPYRIDEYDGCESVITKYEYEWTIAGSFKGG